MDALTASLFKEIIAGTSVGGEHPVIRHVSTHSRRIHSGSAFFAIDGNRAKGHSFASQALQNGAAVAVVRAGALEPEPAIADRVIEVDDPLTALQRLAGWWRSQITGQIVAVVGGNGKTVTKDALAHLLAEERSVYASPGSYNSKLGVPLALLGCPRDCEVGIFELAISEPGEMATLQRMVRPNHVVMTNLGARWRSNFDDRSHQAREMLASCAEISDGGWLLLGQSDETIDQAASDTCNCRRLVAGDASQLPTFQAARYAREGLLVQAHFPDGESGTLNVRTPSEEILADVQLAASAAWLLGAKPSSLLTALSDYRPTSTRMEIWRSPAGITLIRDVATPDPIALGSAIRAAKRLAGGEGRTVVVLADQLQPPEQEAIRELVQTLEAERIDAVYAVRGPFPDALASAAGSHAEEPVDAVAVPVDAMAVHLFATTDELRVRLLEDLRVGDVALVQSPPSAPIDDLSTELIGSMAPTRLYLDLSAIEENVSTFRRIVGPSVQVMGMVKALAYGTDGVTVASCLESSGIDRLGVSNADEGVALRQAGIALPILVMLGTGRDLERMLRHRLTPLIYSEEMLEAVLGLSSTADSPLSVHLKVDSGMHRTGFAPEQMEDVLARLERREHVRLEGLLTHFACADDPFEDAFTLEQLASFERTVALARSMGFEDLVCHAAATAATIRLPQTHLDMVRIGIGLYGVHPSQATRAQADLVPAFALVSRIVEILELSEGDRIGYGGTYRVPAGGARVGVVPAGYHDCVPRHLSNVGHVVVAGMRCPIVGRVSMDSMTVDLSACADAHVGSDVLILGRYGDWLVSPESLAESIGTIPYEFMVRVGPRVQRILTQH
jgi:alanine racemase